MPIGKFSFIVMLAAIGWSWSADAAPVRSIALHGKPL